MDRARVLPRPRDGVLLCQAPVDVHVHQGHPQEAGDLSLRHKQLGLFPEAVNPGEGGRPENEPKEMRQGDPGGKMVHFGEDRGADASDVRVSWVEAGPSQSAEAWETWSL